MSDLPSSRRKIGGLSSLARMRGDAPAEPVTIVPAVDEAAAPPEPARLADRPQAAPGGRQSPRKPSAGTKSRPRSSQAVTAAPRAAAAASKEQMTTYISPSVRGRAQTAYEATRYLEGDASWSEFVATALERETQRREQLHNAGEPYPPRTEKLRAGRPLG
jgi:hypothetical protein